MVVAPFEAVSHGSLSPDPESPQAWGEWERAYSTERFNTIAEFYASSGYAFTAFTITDMEREFREDATVAYTFTPRGFSYTAAGVKPIALAFERGVQPICVRRDVRTEQLSLAQGHSSMIATANAAIKMVGVNARDLLEADWIAIDGPLPQFNGLSAGLVEIRITHEYHDTPEGRLLLVAYESKPFAHAADGYTIEQRFFGFALMDEHKTHTYHNCHRYEGTIRKADQCTESFAGQELTYLAKNNSGVAVIPPTMLARLAELLKSYPRINTHVGSWDDASSSPPDWFANVFSVSRVCQVSAVTIAEARTNLAPIVAAVIAAHVIDGAWTLGTNMGYDLRQLALGVPGASFNPFDGDVKSLLLKYVYEPAAGGYVMTAAGLGWIDESKVEAYAEVGGALLKLPVDIVAIAANPHALWGSSAHLTGASKSATIVLGKLIYANSQIIPQAVSYANLLSSGYRLTSRVFTLFEAEGVTGYAGSFYRSDTSRLDDAREGHLVATKAAALDLSRRLARHDVDVLFLADNTGSMSGIIAAVKTNAQAILNALAGDDLRFADVEINWGVARYVGDPVEGVAPTTAYQLIQPITDSKEDVQAGINTWYASGGGDLPEAVFFAIQQAATEGDGIPRDGSATTGQEVGWRDGAAKVIVVFGDAPSHQSTVNEKELRQVLADNSVTVSFIDTSGLNSGSNSDRWDATRGTQQYGAAQELADGSQGAYVRLTDVDKVTEAIMNAVYDSITENVRTGGQLVRIDASKIWRSRTASAVTADTPDDGDTFEFTLRYPGQAESMFSVDMTGGTTVPGKAYLERTAIAGGADMFGADLSSDVLVQFTPEKDFVRFMLSDGAAAAVEGYYGYRLPSSALPSSGISVFDVSSRSVSPYDSLSYSSGELDTRLFVNWTTGKVFGIDRASPHPGSGVGIFLGTVDEESREIDGAYTAKTSRYSASEPGIVPRYIEDTRRGNTNLQLYGERQVAGVAGTFSVNWHNEAQTPSYTSMLMAGFKDDDALTYTSVSSGESWQGFAVGIVHDRSNGDMAIATNETPDNVQMTFQPSAGEFAGSIRVSDGANSYSLTTTEDDSAYISPQAFGAVTRAGAPAHIATTMNGVEEYNYLSWGSWSVDAGTSPEKSIFAHSPWIAGRLTPGNQVPTTGTATYNGSAWGQLNDGTSFTSVAGNAALAADYGTRTLTGSFSNMKRADGSAWTDVGVNASWGSANSQIAGTTSAPGGLTGTVNGAFFGPAAQEVGGNWTLQGGATQAAGVFTGKK